MEILENGVYEGERALFHKKDLSIRYCTFQNGESPLKEGENFYIKDTSFKWKYPLWYCKNVKVEDSYFLETARSGIWYTENIDIKNSVLDAPKLFRRCKNVSLENVAFYNAEETFLNTSGITLKNVMARGKYFASGSENITAENLEVVGDYVFDGSSNITVKNSRFISKDAFWNTENVVVENSYIVGEYLAWNAKNITFVNCTIESLQGLCYVDGLKMINCRLLNTTLSFEYSANIDAEITTVIDSVKNPSSGVIKAKGIKELILEEDKVDINAITIKIDLPNKN